MAAHSRNLVFSEVLSFVTIKQIYNTIEPLCILDGEKDSVLSSLNDAEKSLQKALDGMNSFSVAGRGVRDHLLGCMMAIDAIIGKDGGEANG